MKNVIAGLIALSCAAWLSGQEFRGGFSGSVTDPSGAAIPKAKIVATEIRTGAKSSSVSESSGEFAIPFLTPGEYEISAEAPGFKRFVRKGITLSAGEHPVIDVHMEVGAVNEAVTVNADAPLVVSGTASVGQIITTKEVEDLPVNGRTPMMLANLAFGVISTFEPGPVRPFDNGAPNAVSIGGAPSGTNEVLLNGAPNAGFSKQMAYSPPHDAVQEVRVSVFESDATYGHSGGGTINLFTKGGTNGLHGSASEYNQSSALDANAFFTNKAGVPRPAYNYNQFGFAVGGPVWIPKVFNGKNKVFWFLAYEGLRDADPANSPIETGSPVNFATVPTTAERGGDFSALPGLGPSYKIYDPLTGTQSGTTITRQVFPNNVIPPQRLNAVAMKYLQYFPQATGLGTANGFGNYVVNAIDRDGYDNELGRLDVNLSDRNKMFFEAHHNYRAQDKNNYFHNAATGTFLYRINHGLSLDDVYTITPTTVMDVRFNWTRYIENRAMPNTGLDPTTLGFPAYIGANSEALQLPQITFTSTSVSAGGQTSFQSLGGNGDGANAYDSFQLFGEITKVHGNHIFKFGTDIREYRWSVFTHGNSAGAYTFTSNNTGSTSNAWTNGPNPNSAPSPLGQDFAAFLLGFPTSGSYDLNSQSTTQSKYFSLFLQDDWRWKSNLTLNLGIRWEHETPTTERFNRAVDGFDPAATNSISAAAAAAYNASPIPQIAAGQFRALGGPTFASTDNPALYHTSAGLFSPRFGFAWTPKALGSKTVVRGGLALFVSPIEIIGNGETSSTVALSQAGFSQSTSYNASNNSFLTPATNLSDPFPTGFVAPAGSSRGASTFLGQNLALFNPNPRNPYSIRWNFGVQRELPGHFVMEVAYIGNHVVHLPISTQLDYVPRQYLSTSQLRDAAAVTLLTGTVTNPLKGLLPNSSSLNGSTIARQQLLIPFPQYAVGAGTSNGIVLGTNPAGSSYYHSFNVRVQKRFTNGLTLLNNFIWSKLVDHLVYLNDFDPAPEKRVSSDSRPLREVLAASYQLPGKFQNRITNAVLGRWAINGIATFQSGPPLGWGNVVYLGGPLNFNPHQPNGPAFDINQFVTASSVQPTAQNIRVFDTNFNNLRRDPTKNVDMSILKKFGLGEKRFFEVRFEAFNVTNRVGFGGPNLSPTNLLFGQITTQANTPRRVQVGARLVW